MTNREEIDQLRSELAAVKRQLAGADVPSEKEVGAWRDAQHQLAERRAAGHLPFSREDIEAFRAAFPDDVAKAIALRDARAPQGPSSQGAIPSSQQVSNVNLGGSPRGTGWAREIPLGPPPGIGYVDRLLEVDAAKQRGEAMVEEAKRKAAEKSE